MHLLHEREHDSFWHHIDHGSADNVVVGCDEQFCSKPTLATFSRIIFPPRRRQGLTYHLNLLTLFITQCPARLQCRWRRLHSRQLLLVLTREETAKESGAVPIARTVKRWAGGTWRYRAGWEGLAGLGIDLHGARGSVALVYYRHRLVVR